MLLIVKCLGRRSRGLFGASLNLRSVQTLQKRHCFKDIGFDDIPEVSVSTIRTRLRRSVSGIEDAHTDFIINCPICENTDGEVKKRIFVNKRTGAFTCEYCKHTGSWMLMDSYLTKKKGSIKDAVVFNELEYIKKYLEDVPKQTKDFKTLTDFSEILNAFNLPDYIEMCTLHKLEIRIDITHSKLYVPLRNASDEMVGYRVYDRTSAGSVEPNLTYTHNSGIIISRWKSKNAVIVSNLSDFLVLVQSGVPYNVVCLPEGLSRLSQHVLPAFGQFNKLVLWFGNEVSAWDTARTYAKKLGEKRCMFIRPVDKVSSPSVDPGQDFKAIISGAQPISHKSITTFATFRQDVLAELQNVDRAQGVKWKRFPGLTKVLKGHRRGELTVFTGPTGSGKTTFISEYSLDLAMQGVNTLWGSFEIRNTRLAKTMLQQMAGVPLDEHLDQYDHWADVFEQLPIYYMTFHGQQSIKIVMEAIEHATYVHDIAHVIIDNLQFMMGLSEESRNLDRFWRQDLIVSNLRSFATRHNCHVTLVIHPRKERHDEELTTSSIFGGAKASQEADNILIIQDKRLMSVKGKKYLQICKNRYSGDLGIMPLDFEKSSLSFALKKKKEDTRKVKEIKPPDE